jgi:hypothetical protein
VLEARMQQLSTPVPSSLGALKPYSQLHDLCSSDHDIRLHFIIWDRLYDIFSV